MRRTGFLIMALICAAVTGAAGCTTAGDGETAALLVALREPYCMECTVSQPGSDPVRVRYTHTISADTAELLEGECAGCLYVRRGNAFSMRCGSVEGPVKPTGGGLFDLFYLLIPDGTVSSGKEDVRTLRNDGGEIHFLRGVPFEATGARGIRVSVLSFEPSVGQAPASDGGEGQNDTG